MLKKLDKRENVIGIHVEPNAGERALLSSDNSGVRSPALDLKDTITEEQKKLLDQLAEILVEGFLWQYEHGEQQQTGSDLLPGVDKRTS